MDRSIVVLSRYCRLRLASGCCFPTAIRNAATSSGVYRFLTTRAFRSREMRSLAPVNTGQANNSKYVPTTWPMRRSVRCSTFSAIGLFGAAAGALAPSSSSSGSRFRFTSGSNVVGGAMTAPVGCTGCTWWGALVAPDQCTGCTPSLFKGCNGCTPEAKPGNEYSLTPCRPEAPCLPCLTTMKPASASLPIA